MNDRSQHPHAGDRQAGQPQAGHPQAGHPWFAHYPEGIPHALDFEELTVVDFLKRTAERLPHRPALCFMNVTLSWRELKDQVDRCATAMAELGVYDHSTVAIQLPNLPQTVIAYYAALSLGARVVLTNPLYTEREIEHQWNDAGVSVAVVTDFLYDQKVRKIRKDLRLSHVMVASIPEYLRFPLNLLAPLKLKRQDPPLVAKVRFGEDVHPFKKLLAGTQPDPPRVALDLNAVAVLQYTGGTTGPSKGAMLTHRNLSCNVQQIASFYVGMEYGSEVVLTCLPLFHVFGMSVCMNYAVFDGATMVLVPNPRDVDAIVKAIAKHEATIFPGVPALYNALNHFPGIESANVKSLKVCLSGSAPIPPDVLERFESLTGARIIEGFGMSETSPVTHVNPLVGVRKIGSIGIPLPSTESRVVDMDEGTREMPLGEEGELVVRGPQVMAGYYERPEETANALRNGWMHTGDLATQDEDGYFRIVGRKKDMINANGLKVFPDEVDKVLMAHDAILEAATIGVPHPTRGETVKSFLVLVEGAALTSDEVESYAREHLAAYKIPREIEFLDELPKSTVLKVLRRELRDRELAKRSADPGA